MKFTRKKMCLRVTYKKKSFTFSFDHDLEGEKRNKVRENSIDSKSGADTRESALSLSKEEISHTANSGTVNQPPFNGHNKIT